MVTASRTVFRAAGVVFIASASVNTAGDGCYCWSGSFQPGDSTVLAQHCTASVGPTIPHWEQSIPFKCIPFFHCLSNIVFTPCKQVWQICYVCRFILLEVIITSLHARYQLALSLLSLHWSYQTLDHLGTQIISSYYGIGIVHVLPPEAADGRRPCPWFLFAPTPPVDVITARSPPSHFYRRFGGKGQTPLTCNKMEWTLNNISGFEPC